MEVTVLNGRFVNRGFVKQRMLLAACSAMAATLRVKTPDLFEPVRNLSGGNQQKVRGRPLAVDVSADPDPR